MQTQENTFYQFLDLRWEEATDVLHIIFDGIGALRLGKDDFPKHAGSAGLCEAPYMLAIAVNPSESGLVVSSGQRVVTLDAPLALALYDWLGWDVKVLTR